MVEGDGSSNLCNSNMNKVWANSSSLLFEVSKMPEPDRSFPGKLFLSRKRVHLNLILTPNFRIGLPKPTSTQGEKFWGTQKHCGTLNRIETHSRKFNRIETHCGTFNRIETHCGTFDRIETWFKHLWSTETQCRTFCRIEMLWMLLRDRDMLWEVPKHRDTKNFDSQLQSFEE